MKAPKRLITPQTLLPKTLAKIKPSAQLQLQASQRRVDTRDAAIADAFKNGGKRFVAWVRKYGCTEQGEPLIIHSNYAEYLEAIASLVIGDCYTSGPAQCGKTLGHLLMLCYDILQMQINVAMFYDIERTRDRNVPLQFRPLMRNILLRLDLRVPKQEDARNNGLFQYRGTSAIFSYASTSNPTRNIKAGGAAVGTAAASISVDKLYTDERSKFPPGSADPLPRRLDASRIPTQPTRHIGTPGGGLGIERDMATCPHHFYPHTVCPHCKQTIALDPKGCLLKPAELTDATGRKRSSYLSESGRPILKTEADGTTIAYWHHSNPARPIASAFIGCSNCGAELNLKSRLEDSFFQCLKTSETLRHYLDHLPPHTAIEERIKVAIQLSPLTRPGNSRSIASRLIQDGFELLRSTDWQQQGLGHPSESENNSVPIDLLYSLIGAPRPAGIPDLILAGGDQGRNEDWLWICHYFLPPNSEYLPIAEVMDRTMRVVVFGGDIVRSEIPAKLKEHHVDFGLFDNEPDRADISNNLCRTTVLEMADQRPGLLDAVKEGTVSDGGIDYACWQVRNEKFLKQVLNNFFMTGPDGVSLYRLPQSWDRWKGLQGSDRSPLVHLAAPSYDPDTGKWKRGDGNVDDLYYAAMFAEAALYLQLMKRQKKRQADWIRHI